MGTGRGGDGDVKKGGYRRIYPSPEVDNDEGVQEEYERSLAASTGVFEESSSRGNRFLSKAPKSD